MPSIASRPDSPARGLWWADFWLLGETLLSVFLIGAGFNVDAAAEAGPVHGDSIYAGHYRIDCGYPLMADTAGLSFGLSHVPPGKSIEDLFSEALGRGDYAPLEKLSDRLMEADFRLACGLASSGASNCYSEFFKTFDGANFLTFNYDSLPEIFLFRLMRWYPHDGYGLPVAAELAPLQADQFAGLKSTCLVLHLHGSFCVYTSEFEIRHNPGDAIAWLDRLGRPRYGFDPDSISLCFPPYRRAMSSTGRVPIEERVIAPIPDKAHELKQPFIAEAYRKACSLVRQSGTLVTIGYSFNSYDRPSYQPVLQALDESPGRKLIVVSPKASEPAARISKEYPRLHVVPIERTLKSWAADSFRC